MDDKTARETILLEIGKFTDWCDIHGKVPTTEAALEYAIAAFKLGHYHKIVQG